MAASQIDHLELSGAGAARAREANERDRAQSNVGCQPSSAPLTDVIDDANSATSDPES